MSRQKILFGILGTLVFLVAVNLVMGQEKNRTEETEKDTDYKSIDYKYVGESEHWKGEYVIEGEEIWFELDDMLQREYWHEDASYVEYKGELDELETLGQLEIKMETKKSSSGLNASFEGTPPGEKVFNLGGGNEDVFNNPKDPIKIEVTWDGRTEVFQLVREDMK